MGMKFYIIEKELSVRQLMRGWASEGERRGEEIYSQASSFSNKINDEQYTSFSSLYIIYELSFSIKLFTIYKINSFICLQIFTFFRANDGMRSKKIVSFIPHS
jgi:hypothetical protein